MSKHLYPLRRALNNAFAPGICLGITDGDGHVVRAEPSDPNVSQPLDRARPLAVEVIGRDGDQDLVRKLARRLAEDVPEAALRRDAVAWLVANDPAREGGILAALRRSPLVGVDLELSRVDERGRTIDL